MEKEIKKLLEYDKRQVELFLTKVKYHHLPYEANSQAYLDLLKGDYSRLDRNSLRGLLNEA